MPLCRSNKTYAIKTYHPDNNTNLHNAARDGTAIPDDEHEDLNRVNVYGQTPLHLACRNGNIDGIEILLEMGADIRARTKEGETPVHYSVRHGSQEGLQALLKHMPPLPKEERLTILNAKNNNGVTPLMLACKNDDDEMMSTLLGAVTTSLEREMVNATDHSGHTALMFAVMNENTEIINLLIRKDADVKIASTMKRTALHMAKSPDVADILINHGADKEAKGFFNRTPLHEMIFRADNDVAQHMVTQKEANTNATDDDKNTPLHYVCERSITNMIQCLIRYGAIMKGNKDMRTPLHIAVMHDDPTLIQALKDNLSEEALASCINQRDKLDRTALHYAVEKGNLAICKELRKVGASLMLNNNFKKTPLYDAARYGYVKIFEWFKTETKDDKGFGRSLQTLVLIAAAKSGQADFVKHFMFDLKLDPFATDDEGRTALMAGCKGGNTDLVNEILSLSDTDINAHDLQENTALHFAAQNGHQEIIELLLKNKAKISKNESHKTPLDLALLNKHFEAAEVFVRPKIITKVHRLDPTFMDSISKYAPIEFATKLLDREIIVDQRYPKKKDHRKYRFRFLQHENPHYLALKMMVDKERKDILDHPLCTTFLHELLHPIGYLIYVFLLMIYWTFIIFLTVAVALSKHDRKPRLVLPEIAGGARIGTLIFGILNAVIQFAKLVFDFKQVCQKGNWDNVWNILIEIVYVVMFATTFGFIQNPYQHPDESQWICGAVSVALAWFLFIFQHDMLPGIGVYVVMFRKVLESICLTLPIIFCMVVGFGFSFHVVVFSEPFANKSSSIVKATGMTLGELDASDFLTGEYNFKTASYIILFLFIIIMPIAGVNLMIGTAVGEIAKIKSQAELSVLRTKVYYVTRIMPICACQYTFHHRIRSDPIHPDDLEDKAIAAHTNLQIDGKVSDREGII